MGLSGVVRLRIAGSQASSHVWAGPSPPPRATIITVGLDYLDLSYQPCLDYVLSYSVLSTPAHQARMDADGHA